MIIPDSFKQKTKFLGFSMLLPKNIRNNKRQRKLPTHAIT